MSRIVRFEINSSWGTLLEHMGMNVGDVLRRASLPQDLFSRSDAGLNTAEYFRLWRAMEFALNDNMFPLKVGRFSGTELFQPPVFAAYCSPNLNIALQRLQQFKPLIGPMALDVDIQPEATKLTIRFLERVVHIPQSLLGMELIFFVQLARLATKAEIQPIKVTAPFELDNLAPYDEYFGVGVEIDAEVSLSFKRADAERPFLSENESMWQFFEPSLRQRLSSLKYRDGMKERVRSALLDMLPSGQTSVDEVASRLLVSRRTLQRRLGDEGTSFTEVLNGVREELARHYITKSELPYSQISLLLGYENPNSFFRAFNAWTGGTPDRLRTATIH